jgi:hypothetical protein
MRLVLTEVGASLSRSVSQTMRNAGCNVLMEGRSQTLNYVRTPYRFELMLSKPLTIGLRRAAQRLIGAATPVLKKIAVERQEAPRPEEVYVALSAALESLAAQQ